MMDISTHSAREDGDSRHSDKVRGIRVISTHSAREDGDNTWLPRLQL